MTDYIFNFSRQLLAPLVQNLEGMGLEKSEITDAMLRLFRSLKNRAERNELSETGFESVIHSRPQSGQGVQLSVAIAVTKIYGAEGAKQYLKHNPYSIITVKEQRLYYFEELPVDEQKALLGQYFIKAIEIRQTIKTKLMHP